ncbi:MAG TPA: mannose-6-phosphate isomerase [Verrucomicrobiae bacterium]|nr:mannose-6-phosphate isomerase [Verrucomicrobiae bacterium]
MIKSNYDQSPFVTVTSTLHPCVTGWDKIAAELQRAIGRGRVEKPILVVDCYPGVDELAVLNELQSRLAPKLAIHAAEAYHSSEKIETLVAPFLGSDDSAFGRMSGLSLVNFFNAEPLWRFRRIIDDLKEGLVLIVGCGASLIAWGHVLVYADLARRTAQERLHRNETGNLGANNLTVAANLKYKRAFFVDWRVADRWKRPLINRWDYVLDTNAPAEPKLADAGDVRSGMREAVTRPFRLVPVFGLAPWGGRRSKEKEVHNLHRNVENFDWCFDCMPEENSLLLGFGGTRFEIPAIDLLFHQFRTLVGESVHSRFGDGFPIRFNLLNTMGAGNDCIQVHPLADFARQHFGVRRTQDENDYLLDAGVDARVHLGLREGTDPAAMQRDLKNSSSTGAQFLVDKYVNSFPAKRHDHFLIPSGAVHGSANSTTLQIGALPYIFTFDLWNWSRLSWNSKAKPIHLAPDLAKAQGARDTTWMKENLVNHVEPLRQGDGWHEEKIGMHERNFIETHRHWFAKKVLHDTKDGVNVLNLVEGGEAVVESPTDAFAPFVVHYAETFIVPAAVGAYTIRPHGPALGQKCATIKAFVRTDIAHL